MTQDSYTWNSNGQFTRGYHTSYGLLSNDTTAIKSTGELPPQITWNNCSIEDLNKKLSEEWKKTYSN